MAIINCNDEALEYLDYQPTSLTQAYFKLKGNRKDSSGNNRDITATWPTLYSSGVWYNGSSSGKLVFNCPRKATRTVSIWVKYTGGSSSSRRNISYVGGTASSGYYHGLFISSTSRRDLTIKDGSDAISNIGIDGNRHHLVGVFSSGNSKLYLDKTLIATNTNSIGTGTDMGYLLSKNGNEAFIGYFGEIIIEEGNRTLDKISSYYDKKKPDYT